MQSSLSLSLSLSLSRAIVVSVVLSLIGPSVAMAYDSEAYQRARLVRSLEYRNFIDGVEADFEKAPSAVQLRVYKLGARVLERKANRFERMSAPQFSRAKGRMARVFSRIADRSTEIAPESVASDNDDSDANDLTNALAEALPTTIGAVAPSPVAPADVSRSVNGIDQGAVIAKLRSVVSELRSDIARYSRADRKGPSRSLASTSARDKLILILLFGLPLGALIVGAILAIQILWTPGAVILAASC